MIEWIKGNQAAFWWLTAAGVVLFIGSMILVPFLAVRIPPDYFAHERRPRGRFDGQHRAVRIVLRMGKNLLGILFLFAGLAMLVLPGQGVLTLALGFLLIDLPGKYRMEQWLVRRRVVLRAMNWMRRKAGREPLQVRAAANG